MRKKSKLAWSPEVAYALGLISANGYESAGGTDIQFATSCIEQVEHLQQCLSITAKIVIKKRDQKGRRKTYSMQWNDAALYDFFLQAGIMPNANVSLPTPAIPDNYFFHFLRGSHDGDDSFCSFFDHQWKNTYIFFLAFTSPSDAYTWWLRDTLERLCGVKGHITLSGRKAPVYNLKFSKREAIIVLSHMYLHCSSAPVSRKTLKIMQALAIVGMSLTKCE